MARDKERSPEASYDTSSIESGMADLLKKADPSFNLDASPDNDQAAMNAAAEAAAEKEFNDAIAKSPPEGETTEELKAREAEQAEAEKAKADEAKAAEEAATAEAAAKEAETDEDKSARETKEAEEAAAKAKEAEDDPDSDLEKSVKELDQPHVRPKTKKLAEFLKGEAKTARAAQRALAKEKEDLQKQFDELKASAGKDELPKETAEELAQLRQRVQELDASSDPEIVRKFDKPIERNRNSIIETLKSFDLDKVIVDEKTGKTEVDPTVIPELLKQGLNFKTLKPYLDKMEEGGFVDEAESIRDALRENMRLGRDRSAEVEAIKGQVGERVAARTKAAETASAETMKTVYAQATQVLGKDLAELEKAHSQLKKPEAPSPKDSPAVVAAKKAAIAEWEKADNDVAAIVSSFNSVGKNGTDAIAAQSRMVAQAVQAAVIKVRLLPKLARELVARGDEIKSLQAQLAKYKSAGSLTRAHSVAVSAEPEKKDAATEGMDTKDAFKAYARANGVQV